MNGPQDLGGAHGFGPVDPGWGEPKFHDDWERKALALTLAGGALGLWNIDASRRVRESLPHVTYYTIGYYGIWLTALEQILAEVGVTDGTATGRKLAAADVRAALAKGTPANRAGPAPRFAVGDRVRVVAMNPKTHTRAPAYVRGHVGSIVRRHGAHVFPDTNAHFLGEDPKPLYTVRFEAAELWGPDTTAAAVHADLFEPYLVAA